MFVSAGTEFARRSGTQVRATANRDPQRRPSAFAANQPHRGLQGPPSVLVERLNRGAALVA